MKDLYKMYTHTTHKTLTRPEVIEYAAHYGRERLERMFVPIGANPISTRLLGRDECFAEGERDGDDNGYDGARAGVPLASVRKRGD